MKSFLFEYLQLHPFVVPQLKNDCSDIVVTFLRLLSNCMIFGFWNYQTTKIKANDQPGSLYKCLTIRSAFSQCQLCCRTFWWGWDAVQLYRGWWLYCKTNMHIRGMVNVNHLSEFRFEIFYSNCNEVTSMMARSLLPWLQWSLIL